MFSTLSNLTRDSKFRRGILYATSALVVSVMAMGSAQAVAAPAGAANISIDSQPLDQALLKLSLQSNTVIYANADLVAGKSAPKVYGNLTLKAALGQILKGTGLSYTEGKDGTIVITQEHKAPSAQLVKTRAAVSVVPKAASAGESTIQEVIVTARRKKENIIDVPMAVSAFSAQQLEERKIEGGSELLRVIPNVNFSKDNFTGYNFSIRGIGVKALATTADPGVAISFNNTALLRNRLFEQEYFDVQRLEVLRGPQGTLYGRNATAGVVNMLPNLPELGKYSAELQGEVGNYDAHRLRGMINIPITQTLAVRAAGAWTQRDGYDYNTVTQKNVNGRNLWSGRLGVLWQPTDNFRANLLWEHFEEDDDRARTGKQLCNRAESAASVDWTDPKGGKHTSTTHAYWTRNSLTPGCQAKSLYSDEAFGVPNGRGFPVVASLINMTPFSDAGREGYGDNYLFHLQLDPFATKDNRQVADLRTISTSYDPEFHAKNDVAQLNLEWDLTDKLTLFSQSLYMEDSYFGRQDFFRSQAIDGHMARKEQLGAVNGLPRIVQPIWQPWLGTSTPTSGVFLDPQLGATDRFMAIDQSQARSKQWSQEFRLQSKFDGNFNFNLGANWLNYETEENYYIFSNVFTLMAIAQNQTYVRAGDFDQYCNLTAQGQGKVNSGKLDRNVCAYIDPNPLDSINGEGHNYVRNVSIAKTESWAAFGEGYWTLRDNLRLTLGLRYTDDIKTMTPVPSQLLASTSGAGAGFVGRGYPQFPDEKLRWGEWTGRAVIDWKPDVSFTDDTLVYASYSRGYKGGGGNPRDREYNPKAASYPSYPAGFEPEFVNAYEIGMKNVLADRKLMLNATAFLYDYKDYQVAQLIDRSIHNENFDAKIMGLEFEAAWSPTRNFRLDATLGLMKTRIADGEESVDVMDRLQGHDDWVVMRPWPTSPATCIVPKQIIGRYIEKADYTLPGTPNAKPSDTGSIFIKYLCPGPGPSGGFKPGGFFSTSLKDAWGNLEYNSLTAPNQGRGFSTDLSGNELPNAPQMTFNIGAQYRVYLPGWNLDLRGDYYRQSDSWMRVYNNAPYDRLKGWGNANLSATLTRPADNLTVQLYVKNVFDDTPITDGFTGPDELGNFTNVFTLDPRLIGLSIRKRW